MNISAFRFYHGHTSDKDTPSVEDLIPVVKLNIEGNQRVLAYYAGLEPHEFLRNFESSHDADEHIADLQRELEGMQHYLQTPNYFDTQIEQVHPEYIEVTCWPKYKELAALRFDDDIPF